MNFPSFLVPSWFSWTIVGAVSIGLIVVFVLFRSYKKLFSTLLMGLVLIGGGLLIWSFWRDIKQQKKTPLTSRVLFKKMEYMHNLKLVSYYSEEIIVLGTKENVLKVVEGLEKKLTEAKQKTEIAKKRYDFAVQKQDSILNSFVNEKSEAKNAKEKLKSLEKRLANFMDCKKDELCFLEEKVLELDTNLILQYASYKEAHQAYKLKADNFAKKPWKKDKGKLRLIERAKVRKALLNNLDSLKNAKTSIHQSIVSNLKMKIHLEELRFDELIDENKSISNAQKKLKQLANNKRKQFRKLWDKQIQDENDLEAKLAEALLELEFAEELGDEIDPEVLIVVPAEVSVFIDMDQVLINESLAPDSSLIISLPPLQFSPILIELPTDSAVYKLARGKKTTSISEQGAYYDLFGQLKVAIIEKEEEARANAIKNGILQEGQKMAKSYITTFVEPLGFNIQFVEDSVASPLIDLN